MKFDKYQAAGNDFIIVNGLEKSNEAYNAWALKMCDRHFGIGADGLLVCKESSIADIKMLYFNSDGSQGEMCGNGIRCFSKYIYDYKIIKKQNISIETLSGVKYISMEIDDNDNIKNIKVDMGYPIFEGLKIPVDIEKQEVLEEEINIDGKMHTFSAVNVGVPHVVIFVGNIDEWNIDDIGEKIEYHTMFPKKTNVNFVEIKDKNNINIYTWERGAGRTLGCGTGSCSSVTIGNKLNKLDKKVNVKTEGGDLSVELESDYKIYMSGNATHIAKGDFSLI